MITQEDIRRSGVTNVPEALRMAPGVDVAKIDSNKWAISVRGFNNRFANKLLVLVDGRSVYDHLFSGVFWEIQDMMLEDIDRIEVIRGPGATLWGANAVNGVINIITKKSSETQGGLVSALGGTEEQGTGAIRFGGHWKDNFHFRAYAKYFNRGNGFPDSTSADAWHGGHGGGRADFDITENDLLTVQGDYYLTKTGWPAFTFPLLTPPFSTATNATADFSGGNIFTRWNHRFSETSDLKLQAYYDRSHLLVAGTGEDRNNADVDFQHRFAAGSRNDIIYGVGYRFTGDHLMNNDNVIYQPDRRNNHLFSGFIQDCITLVRERLNLTLGSKFEHNDQTGFEVEPNARILWTPHPRHSIWASFTRAVRTPARSENDVRANLTAFPDPTTGATVLTALFGNTSTQDEVLLATEMGYRVWPTDHLSIDLAGFWNHYSHLGTVEPGTPFPEAVPTPHITIPLNLANKMHGDVFGAELAIDWNILRWWKIRSAYSYLKMDLAVDATSLNPTAASGTEGESPRNQFTLRSTMDLPHHLEFDWWFRFVDKLPTLGIKRYATLDVRLGWKPIPSLDISVAGQNLLQAHHSEFAPSFVNTQPSQVERSVYGKVTWTF